MRVGVLHPGEMGAAVGAQLVAAGHDVCWQPEGRSEATHARAAAAGLRAVADVRDADAIISVCPPGAALDVAGSLSGARSLIIDANAVSPRTAEQIGGLLDGRWVDGAIIGPPPARAGTTRLYLSGEHAVDAAELFAGTALEPVVLAGAAVAASAVKMAYAAWTKGSAALLLAAAETARAHGVDEALSAEWSRSQPQLADRLARAQASARAKGWRWVAEMNEIADTFAASGQPDGFHRAAAEIYGRFERP